MQSVLVKIKQSMISRKKIMVVHQSLVLATIGVVYVVEITHTKKTCPAQSKKCELWQNEPFLQSLSWRIQLPVQLAWCDPGFVGAINRVYFASTTLFWKVNKDSYFPFLCLWGTCSSLFQLVFGKPICWTGLKIETIMACHFFGEPYKFVPAIYFFFWPATLVTLIFCCWWNRILFSWQLRSWGLLIRLCCYQNMYLPAEALSKVSTTGMNFKN